MKVRNPPPKADLSQRLTEKPRNIKLIYLSSIIGGMLFFLPILVLYYEETLFSVINVALIFAAKSITTVLFELPSGAVADLFGRKNSMILGNIIALLSLVFLAIGGSMFMFIAYAVFTHIGRAFVSGSDNALIYDSLKVIGKTQFFEKTIGTYYATWAIGASFGSIVGGYLGTISFKLPIYLTFIPLLVATIIIFYLQEPPYEKSGHKNIAKQMWQTAKLAFTTRNFAFILAAAFIIFGFGENLFMLSPLFLKFKNITVEGIGYFFAAITALVAIGEYYGYEFGKKLGRKNALIWIMSLSAIFFIIATLFSPYFAVVLLAIPALLFGFRHTIITGLLNEGVDSAKRATMQSLWNLSGYFGIMICSPFVGWLADLYNINTAFRIAGILLIIAPILYSFLKIKKPNYN